MSTKGIYDDVMNAYKQKQWQEAEDLLLTINSDTANYFLGVINYQQQDYSTSINYLEKIPTTSFWNEESEFRLALTYLSLNNVEEAKIMLITISGSPSNLYKEKAMELLDKI